MLDSVLQELFQITENIDPELHHAVDPFDVDHGPFQTLARGYCPAGTEQAPEAGSMAV